MIPDQMALTVHGKKRNIHWNDFLALAQNGGISEKAAENMIRSILKKGQSQELWDFKSHPRVIPRTRPLGDVDFIPANKILSQG